MNNKKLFICISFVWTYVFWLLAIYLSHTQNLAIVSNEVIIMDMLKGTFQFRRLQIIISALLLIAGFGPLVGGLIIIFKDLQAKSRLRDLLRLNFGCKNLLEILFIIFMVGVFPSLIIGFGSNKFNLDVSIGSFVIFGVIFFLFQLFTAGTEEIGWRGYLLPKYLEDGMTMWRASLRIGLIWAAWHYPIFIFVYWQQGMPLYIIPLTLLGFTAGTVAMSVIHTYYLVRSRSVLLSMIIHALYNTLPLMMGLLIVNSFFTALIVQVGLWVVIWIIERREGKIFDQKFNLDA